LAASEFALQVTQQSLLENRREIRLEK